MAPPIEIPLSTTNQAAGLGARIVRLRTCYRRFAAAATPFSAAPGAFLPLVGQCTLREREARIGLPAARFAGQAARVPLLKVTAVGEDGLEVRSSFATSRSVTAQRETRQRGEPHSRGGPHESLRATPQQSFLNSLTLSNHLLTPFLKSPESSNPARSGEQATANPTSG